MSGAIPDYPVSRQRCSTVDGQTVRFDAAEPGHCINPWQNFIYGAKRAAYMKRIARRPAPGKVPGLVRHDQQRLAQLGGGQGALQRFCAIVLNGPDAYPIELAFTDIHIVIDLPRNLVSEVLR